MSSQTPFYIELPSPDYVTESGKSRDELLSQVGNFTHAERETFHELCNVWRPGLTYTRAVSHSEVHRTDAAAVIDSLMEKLERGRCGLITTQLADGKRIKHEIILTQPESPLFYAYLVREEYHCVREWIGHPLPTDAAMAERGFEARDIPAEDMSLASLAQLFSAGPDGTHPLYVVSLEAGSLYLPADQARHAISVCIGKLRSRLSHPDLLSEVSELLGESVLAVKQRLASREPQFWYGIAGAIRQERDSLASRFHSTGAEFFLSADLLHGFISSQMEQARRRKEEESERKADMDALVASVGEYDDVLMPRPRLDALIEALREKYGSAFQSFRQEFYDTRAKSDAANQLPPVVTVGDDVIHRDHIMSLFRERIRRVRSDLMEEYRVELIYQLRTNNREDRPVFFSPENFETDLQRRLPHRDAYAGYLLAHPQLLAQAIVHDARNEAPTTSAEELRRRLFVYFDAGGNELRPYTELLGIDVRALFQKSFGQLNVFRQLWMKVTGRYESLLTHFARFARYASPSQGESGGADAGAPDAEEQRSSSRQRAQEGRTALRGSGGASRGATRRASRSDSSSREKGASQGKTTARDRKRSGGKNRPPKPETRRPPRPYTDEQRDSAWKDFEKSIRKK